MDQDIPGLVKSIRKARNLTQEGLAHKLGVTFSTVNGWENGRHHPIPALVAVLQKMAADAGRGRTRIATRRQRGMNREGR